MQDQIRLLQILQQHDARLQEIKVQQTRLPEQINAAKRAMKALGHRLEQERAALIENETFLQAQETEQKSVATQLAKSKAKLSQVRNTKEANALQKEMDASRRMLDTREEEIKRLKEALEQKRNRLVDHEAQLQTDMADMAVAEEQQHKQLDRLQDEKNKEEAARILLTQQIGEDVLKRYESVRKRKWPALVTAPKGTCEGCHMSIPPQTYNDLLRGQTLQLCAHCNRLLYFIKNENQDSQSSAS